jgi:hypothetical protein
MTFKKSIIVACTFISCLIVGQAFANDARLMGILNGKYLFSANGACIESTGGFSPRPYLEPLGGTTVYNEYLTGTIAFDGNGNALQSHSGMDMFDGPYFPFNLPVGTFVSNCTYSYEVNPDLSFTMEGACISTLPDGPAQGQTATLTGIKLVGFVKRDGDIVLISGIEPSEQDLVLSGGYTAKRLCSGSGTYFKAGR